MKLVYDLMTSGLFYSNPYTENARSVLEEGQFYLSKLPESMDRLFTSDGTVKGGFLCVKNPDGSWGCGQASKNANKADGRHNQQ